MQVGHLAAILPTIVVVVVSLFRQPKTATLRRLIS
jgi:hypothetical protein